MLTPNLFNKIGFRESIQYDGSCDESVVMDCSCLSKRKCVLCGECLSLFALKMQPGTSSIRAGKPGMRSSNGREGMVTAGHWAQFLVVVLRLFG